MSDFHVRSDSVNVEQIMEQIRARIREKRGTDYTEQDIRDLAAVKLEKVLDPRGVRSDILAEFRRTETERVAADLPNYSFESETIYESHRSVLRGIRRLLQPILKLFFNPNRLIQALNIQSKLNTMLIERDATRRGRDQLQYELLHNLVIETTRLSIEVKNLKMQLDSFGSRLDFSERRVRALEGVVVYKPSAEEVGAPAPAASGPTPPPETPMTGAPAGAPQGEGPGQRSRRRRRRRGRRGTGPAAVLMGVRPGEAAPGSDSATAPEADAFHGGTAEPAEHPAANAEPGASADLAQPADGEAFRDAPESDDQQ
jgi:hypothetical protein